MRAILVHMDMLTFSALSSALTSLKTIIDIAKSANNQQFGQQLNSAVLDLQGKLMEIQQQALSLQQDNQTLRDELKKFKDHKDTAAKMHFDGHVYWKDDDVESPFCQICWDVDKALVRLQNWGEGTYSGISKTGYRCITHKHSFMVPTKKTR
jgi:hypothetical protein